MASENLLVVDVTVDPSKEEEWNKWYDEVHLPEIVNCPGFVKGTRYVSNTDGEHHYITIYELTGPEAVSSAEFKEKRGWGKFSEDVKANVRLYKRIKEEKNDS